MVYATKLWCLQKAVIDGLITLPEVDHLSKLSQNLVLHLSNRHPHEDDQYPLIIADSKPIRSRILALGGPYDPSISYRREVAGHLHSGARCYLCLEVFTTKTDGTPGGFRAKVCAWSMQWCEICLKKWTVSPQAVLDLRGLHTLLRKSEKDVKIKSVWFSRFNRGTQSYWKPFVDDVLRKSIHIDFDITVAKDEYIHQVRVALSAVKKPITVIRQALRRDMAKIAQKLSSSSSLNSYSGTAAKIASLTFAKPQDLPTFLYPPHLLYKDRMFDPFDPDEVWLADPTMDLTSAAEVLRKMKDTSWKEQKVRAMLNQLFSPHRFGAGVTTFLRAAEEYHVRRISNNISAEATINALNLKFPNPVSPFRETPSYTEVDGDFGFCHLDVILSKLLIYRSDFTYLPQLTPQDLKLAKEVYFKKLALRTCAVCPHSGLLTFPRGLEGVVRHYRECHASKFWKSLSWTIIG